MRTDKFNFSYADYVDRMLGLLAKFLRETAEQDGNSEEAKRAKLLADLLCPERKEVEDGSRA